MSADLHLADLFAGGGGFSTGVAEACEQLGKDHDALAVNHWDVAARTYKRNHPRARVLCTGLDAVIPTQEVPGGRLNLLVASPECTHHSRARGGRPMNNQSRASAWLILKWLQELYVESIVIENVHEFVDWGPLGADGRPLKKLRGALFDQFISSLNALGYNVEWRVLNAANYGGATARERLFIMGRRGRNRRIVWPEITHTPTGHGTFDSSTREYSYGEKQRWRPAREIIDWTIPSQSIFTRKRPLAPATLERIAAGLRKFGGKAADPFLVVLRQHMDARSIDEPVPTLTAGGEHVGICEPFIVPQFGESSPRSIQRPLGAITTTSRGCGLCQPFVMSMEHSKSGRYVYNADRPMPTITTVDAWGLVEPFIAELRGGKGANSIEDPLSTVTMKGAHHALVEPLLVEYHGSHEGRQDGARRVRTVDEPLPTQTTENRFGLLEPLIVSYYGTQNVRTVGQPLPTATAKDRFGLVQFDGGHYLDIHFRMLNYRELANAMGFPACYEFEGTREEKVRQIGNAVEVNTARALARAALAA